MAGLSVTAFESFMVLSSALFLSRNILISFAISSIISISESVIALGLV
jgi:hypothetical protein